MPSLLPLSLIVMMALTATGSNTTVRLNATADIWLSDANARERNSSSGKHPRLKLKTIQEMSAIRFDATPAKGREIRSAKLYLKRAGKDMLRHIRVSTINQDWVEGQSEQAYGAPNSSTYQHADATTQRPWAWPGSCFADVIMTSGNSLATWAECEKLDDDWVVVPLTPELVHALVTKDTDGLAIMDGGNLTYHNNFLHSVQSIGNEPYLEVELGPAITVAPALPVVDAAPASQEAHLETGAIQIRIEPAEDVFCWRVWLNDERVPRWQIPHPSPQAATTFHLDDLVPSVEYSLQVVAVAHGGHVSEPTLLTVRSSAVLPPPPALGAIRTLPQGTETIPSAGWQVWPYPPLVKVSPESSQVLSDDLAVGLGSTNAVWDGSRIRLFGARGEYVSYQLCIRVPRGEQLEGVRVRPSVLNGPGDAAIGGTEIELFRNWYARNRDDHWQPAYCLPMDHGEPFAVPDPERGIEDQQNQSIYVDIYIPENALAGEYAGQVMVEAAGRDAVSIPVELRVLDFALPDRLSFWPELNAYRVPQNAHAYYRLAHQHRTVLNCWRWAPRVEGQGADTKVLWETYDHDVGPLLSGDAFQDNRRAGVPIECMYLPFYDSWPTPLTKANYDYQRHWPGRGEDRQHLVDHTMHAPYIGDALSQEYKDAFLTVQRQFIEHFAEMGWDQTEMQCFYGGKATHRIDYGSNMWWTTDEPYHWEDWLALQFFDKLWTEGRGGADREQWPARADISRPQWQGKVLDGIVDTVYFGAGSFNTPDMVRRCQILSKETGLKLMTYGSANPDNESNTRSIAWMLTAWLNGANGVLPWQTLGNEGSLDTNDQGIGGCALLVPGERFGLEVIGDMRLKALRDGQQLIEYLVLLMERHQLQREQVQAMLRPVLNLQGNTRKGAGADNAESSRFETLQAWQISELRRLLAEHIMDRS